MTRTDRRVVKKGAKEKRTWLLSNPAPGVTATLMVIMCLSPLGQTTRDSINQFLFSMHKMRKYKTKQEMTGSKRYERAKEKR